MGVWNPVSYVPNGFLFEGDIDGTALCNKNSLKYRGRHSSISPRICPYLRMKLFNLRMKLFMQNSIQYSSRQSSIDRTCPFICNPDDADASGIDRLKSMQA